MKKSQKSLTLYFIFNHSAVISTGKQEKSVIPGKNNRKRRVSRNWKSFRHCSIRRKQQHPALFPVDQTDPAVYCP